MNNIDREDSLTLEILEKIENKSDVTQRHLADSLGVALGLTNSYLKRCVRKGYIKIKQVPANRYLYYLTPKGFSEKSRLTAKFLAHSFNFYRKASHDYSEIMVRCKNEGKSRIILCGLSELTEIASLRAQEFGITIIGIFDPDTKKDRHLGMPVWNLISNLPDMDYFVLSALNNTLPVYQQIKNSNKNINILIPEILAYVSQEKIRDI